MPDPLADTPPQLLGVPADDLIRRARLLHAAGSVANADIYLLDDAGTPVVLKTFRHRPWLLRVLFSRWTLVREIAILRRLQGIAGIPRLYGRVGRDSFIMEYIAGAGPVLHSRELDPTQYPPREFFVRLRLLVAAMHERGVSHGDLRRLNIIRGPGDTPYLIDFATAISTDGALRALRCRLVALVARADLFSVAKLLHSYYPDLLTAEERQRLEAVPWYLRAGQLLRRHVYRQYIKPKRWRERWTRWRQG